jgi:anti-sigma B factor antagonist
MVTSDGRFAYGVVNGVPVVAAPEEIDTTNASELRLAMLEAARRGRGTLVVDMTRTRFCDSAGLHALVTVHKRAQAESGELRLVMTAAVLRVFEITGLYSVIPNFPSLEQALAYSPPTGRAAISDLAAARLRAANRTGSSGSSAPASGLDE